MTVESDRYLLRRVEYGVRAVRAAWTVKDSKGELLPDFVAGTRLEVARKVVRTRYDAFRLKLKRACRAKAKGCRTKL